MEPEPIDVDLEAAEKIAEGYDSCVYRSGDRAVKEYRRLDLPRVVRYVELLERAAPQLAALDYRPCLMIDGREHVFELEMLPIERVGTGPRGLPVVVSAFVPEPDLDKLTQHPLRFMRYPLDEVEPAESREFFVALNRLFHDEFPTRLRDELHFHVDRVSRLLDRRLGVFGIHIGKYNVKLLPRPDAHEVTLLVTDLAVYLERLQLEPP